jgi:hypothetical protein
MGEGRISRICEVKQPYPLPQTTSDAAPSNEKGRLLLRPLYLLLIAIVFLAVTPCFAQEQALNLSAAALPARSSSAYGVREGRTFFPRHWVRGHLDFDFAPPTNEPDLGRCSDLPAAQFGGASSPCTAYARWLPSGYVELQPIGRTFLRHVFLTYSAQLFFGRNVPQYSYTASFEPMADERSLGVGVELPKHFEFRLASNRSDWLGRYRGNLGPADLGTHPPYGNNATVGIRWNFGGWGRAEE